MTTKLLYRGKEQGFATCYCFRTNFNSNLKVLDFRNGVIELPKFTSLSFMAEILPGCFDKESNALDELNRAFATSATEIQGIRFCRDGFPIFIKKESATNSTDIYLECHLQVERGHYAKHPEIFEEYLKVIEQEITFKNDNSQTLWKNIVEVNIENGWALKAVLFANRWIKWMQYYIDIQKMSVSEAAEKTEELANFGRQLKGSMYYYGIETIAACWKYGEDFKKWYKNKVLRLENNIIVLKND